MSLQLGWALRVVHNAFTHVIPFIINILVIFVNSGASFLPWQSRGLCVNSPSSKLEIFGKVVLCPVIHFKASPSAGVEGHLRGH